MRSARSSRADARGNRSRAIHVHAFGSASRATAGSRNRAFSWEMDRLPGLKPVLEVVERATYASPARPEESWMSTKLLYASHYFESQVDFLTVSDAPSACGAGRLVSRRAATPEVRRSAERRTVQYPRQGGEEAPRIAAHDARQHARRRREGVRRVDRRRRRTRLEPRGADAAIFEHMTARRPFAVIALFAMMHFIVAGTASACISCACVGVRAFELRSRNIALEQGRRRSHERASVLRRAVIVHGDAARGPHRVRRASPSR